jgi:hypothetical protein
MMPVKIIRGASIEIGEDEFQLPMIMDEFQIAMDEDPEDVETLSRDLITLFASLTDAEKVIMNKTLVTLCGFGMRRLLLDAEATPDIFPALGIPMVEEETEEEDGT